MFKAISVLSLIAICCTGQRRWAGSYSRIHPPEDTVTWDDVNYRRPDVETSTEHSIRYRGKWPADNLKGQDVPNITAAPRNPPIRRDEYDSRMDERPRSSTGQTEKSDIDGKRSHDHPLPEDEYHKGEAVRPVIAYEREYFPRDKGKGENQKTNHNIPRPVDTRQHTGSNRDNTEKPKGDFPQDRSQKTIPSASTEAYDNRRRDNLDNKGHEEASVVRRPKGERTQFPTREYVRPRNQPKTGTRDDKAEDHISRGSRNGYKQNSRGDRTVGYDRTKGDSKHEIPNIEQPRDTTQQARNNKGDMDKAYEDLPQDRNQKRYQPVATERNEDKQRDDVSYKGYENVSAMPRPSNIARPQLTAREYIRPRDQKDGDKENRSIYKQSSREETNITALEYTPAQSKGDNGYGYDRQDEGRLAAREYDERREEELKLREYARRLEEELRKKYEEIDNIDTKGRGYSSEEEGRERNHDKGQSIGSNSGNNWRKEQQIKGMISKEEGNMKGIDPNRGQEDHSRREYISRGMVHARREEEKGRNFRAKGEDSPKGNNDELRRGTDTQERQRWKGEGQTTYDLKQEDEYRTMKGDDRIRVQDREANRKEVAQDTRKQIKVPQSEERQDSRVERRDYSVSAKGEVYDRDLGYNPRPSVSRDYKDNMQRTTSLPVDDSLRLVATAVKGHHTRQDNNRNRGTEQPLIQRVTVSSLRPVVNSQRNEGNLRNREKSQHSIPSSEGRNNHQRTTYRRNSEESIDFKSTVTPSYRDVNDRYARRIGTKREESIEEIPNKGTNLHNEGTVPRTDDFVNGRNNARQLTKGSNSWKQSSDNWEHSTSSSDIRGYHPNVSYDAIVFLDDESDEEGDVWNLSDRKTNEPSHVADKGKEDYMKEYRTSVRENQERAAQQRRNEANMTLISAAIVPKSRHRRASEEYHAEDLRPDSSQMDKYSDIHPDVEILPGYGIRRQFDQRNYNDDVIDDEVELFSEKEIKVDARDYKTHGSIVTVGSSNGNSQRTHHSDLQGRLIGNKETQFNTFSGKGTSQDEIVKNSQTDTEVAEGKKIKSIPENSSSSYSTKIDSSGQIHNKPLRLN